jgi:hypothetical protein
MKRLATLSAGLAALMVGFGLFFGPAVQSAEARATTTTRAEIIARAESAIGLTYAWGRESWTPNAGSGIGTDCSGLVLKCWQMPRTMLYQEEDPDNATISPRYSSYEFYNCLGPCYSLLDRSYLKAGDILAYNDGDSGHVVIYAGGDPWNYPIIYESPGSGQTIRRTSRYLGSQFLPRRRYSLLETTSIILDNPTAKSIGGSDLDGNWTRSTNVDGYYGANYQVRAATTTTAWARWTPRFPSAGYYNVYMRWTSASDRASAARVCIKAAGGQTTRYVNQRVNGSTWVLLGRYYFDAGYSTTTGCVVIYATGANGYVVADAVKFVPSD